MNRKALTAILIGLLVSGGLYYGWCSWQWKQAAEANAAEVTSPTPAVSGTPATTTTPGGLGAIVSAVETAPTGHVFTQSGTVSVDARLSNAFVGASGQSSMHLSLTARTGATAGVGPRLPANVVLVIDRSGSMNGERIEHARSAARMVVDSLQDGDSISIVSYSNDARVEAVAQQLDFSSRQRVRDAIARLSVGGGTCVSCGLERARQQLHFNAEGVQRIILLSDGQANSGVTDGSALRSIAQGFEATGAPVSTIGVGLDYNETLMTEIAVGGNGRHSFVEDPSALAFILRDELDSLANTVARRVVARFQLPDGVRFVRGFDRDFAVLGRNEVTVSLGDMPVSTERTALIELAVDAGVAPGDVDALVASVVVEYEDSLTRAPQTVAGQLTARRTDDLGRISGGTEADVAARIETAALNEALLAANEQIRSGNVEQAQQTIQRQWERSRDANLALGNDKLDDQLKAFEEVQADLAAPAAAAEPERKRRAKKNAELNRSLME